MKNLLLVIIVSISIAFTVQSTGSIHGRIKPFNAAVRAWAVSENDTSSGVIQNGDFLIENLKGGRYRVIVEGHLPYKTTTKTDVIVTNGARTDIGEITLDQ